VFHSILDLEDLIPLDVSYKRGFAKRLAVIKDILRLKGSHLLGLTLGSWLHNFEYLVALHHLDDPVHALLEQD
jgi:hypothetical protein